MATSPSGRPSDAELIDLLRDAVEERTRPSDGMVDMIMTGYDITNADASLARLVDDSRLDQVASVRSGSSTVRLLSFSAAGIDFEFELRPTEPRIVGHIDGADGGVIHLEQVDRIESLELDELGTFEFTLHSEAPFRLRHESVDGTSTATEWILP